MSFKKAECCFSFSVRLSIEREQKAAAAANIIYLGGRIYTLCQWTAPGLLCASIHYRHKALDVSPSPSFPCAKHPTHRSVRPLWAVDACSPGRWSNGEECQRTVARQDWKRGVNKLRLLCRIFSRSRRVGASLGKPEFNSPNSAAICEGFFSFPPARLHRQADLVRLCICKKKMLFQKSPTTINVICEQPGHTLNKQTGLPVCKMIIT